MSGKRNATGRPAGQFPVLFDGWPLAYAPGSPAALHLLEIISALPYAWDSERTRQLFGTVPCILEDWDGLEEAGENGWGVLPVFSAVPGTPAGQLRWQQQVLPDLARRTGAKLMHTTGTRLPLFSGVPVIVSPAGEAQPSPTFAGRLAEALGRGGLSGARAVLWPGDLPDPPGVGPLRRVPPLVHQAFYQPQPRPTALPESYVLAPGPLDERELDLLADTWAWTQDGLGEDWGLIVCDLEEAAFARLLHLCQNAGITGRVERAAPALPEHRAALFQQAAAVLSLGAVLPWGDSLLQGLACGRPLVGEESAQTDARAGPGAYLAARGDARALGAALITVIVEEAVGEQLRQAAIARAAAWDARAFSQALASVYEIKNEGDGA